MKNVLLFGASGHLGKEIAKELKRREYRFTIVVRSRLKSADLSSITDQFKIADVTSSESLKDICQGYDVVISALGKSVSIRDKSKATFRDIDFVANSNILDDALKNGISKFIYVSAFHAEKFLHLEYFKVHHDFSEKLKKSGIDFTIIKPPAIFSAFLDIIELAKKGRLVNIGKVDRITNPIFEGDLSVICVDAIKESNNIVEAGGNNIYTRRQLNEIIRQHINPKHKLKSVPAWLIKSFLPFLRLIDKNSFDKFSFFLEVIQRDGVAPKRGEMKFEEYIKLKTEFFSNGRVK